LQNDFSLDYVARQSNSLLPYYYKISAVWGGHEGSLLLWVLVLSLGAQLLRYLAKVYRVK
jgi:cytochrome c-type biogenesis protein CcmF